MSKLIFESLIRALFVTFEDLLDKENVFGGFVRQNLNETNQILIYKDT